MSRIQGRVETQVPEQKTRKQAAPMATLDSSGQDLTVEPPLFGIGAASKRQQREPVNSISRQLAELATDGPITPANVLAMQHLRGNAYVSRMLAKQTMARTPSRSVQRAVNKTVLDNLGLWASNVPDTPNNFPGAFKALNDLSLDDLIDTLTAFRNQGDFDFLLAHFKDAQGVNISQLEGGFLGAILQGIDPAKPPAEQTFNRLALALRVSRDELIKTIKGLPAYWLTRIAQAMPTLGVGPDADQAKDFLAQIKAGKDPTAAGTVTRKDMLDKMQTHLTNDEFATAAAYLMLTVPGSVVQQDNTKTRAIEIIQMELASKDVARSLLDQNTKVIVIPRNKKMTDVVEFDKLKGTKTFDGRDWEQVRGAGGFKVPGVNAIYVAISEENTTGASAEGDAAGTSWCYSPGYSTSVHEMSHVVDVYGISAAQRDKVDAAYKARHDLDVAGTAQEWIDGYNFTDTGVAKVECYASMHRLEFWAQLATAWFGSNVGKDPFTQAKWATKGSPDKANRRNGKAEVERLEPDVTAIFKVVFANKTIDDLNKPRAK